MKKRRMQNEKIRSFRDLTTWKEAHRFALQIYRVTRSFPKEELFGLTDQMKRAAVSLTSNIAEGFSRRSSKDKAHFYTISAGSLTELQSQYTLAKDLEFLSVRDYEDLESQLLNVHRLLNALISSTRDFPKF
ncbi:MAG: four helix bundle protein [Candidatus Uhrbacteria bacterium]